MKFQKKKFNKYKRKKKELKSFIDYEVDISSEDYDSNLGN